MGSMALSAYLRRAAPSWSSTASTWPARSRSRSRHRPTPSLPLSNGWVRLPPDERSRSTPAGGDRARGAPPWLQRLLTRPRPLELGAHDPDCVAVTYAWNPQLSGGDVDFPSDRGPAQRGQVDALQRSDPKRGPGGQLPVRDHRAHVGVWPSPMTASTTWVRSTRASGWSPPWPHSSTSPASCAARPKERAWETNSSPPSGSATPSARWCGRSTTDDVIHVEGKVDPDGDIATINTELILADLQTVDNRLPKLEKEARRQPALAPVVKAITPRVPSLTKGAPSRRPSPAKSSTRRTSPSCSC